jgi:hypothetical protein
MHGDARRPADVRTSCGDRVVDRADDVALLEPLDDADGV